MELDLSVLKKMSPLMTGQQVEVFQVFSNFILGVKLEVDGQFGTKSEKAAKDVQKKLGLAVDGKVGPATWTAILQHIELMPDKYHTFIKDIDNYKNVIDSLNGKIDDCIADENFYKDSIAMLEDTVTDLNEKIENNGKHVLGRYAEYESAIEELNNKLYDMDLVVHEQERMLIENDYDIIEKDKKIEALHDDLKDHEKRINELYGRLKDCNTFAPDEDESEKEKVIPPDYTVRELLHMLIDKIFRREA